MQENCYQLYFGLVLLIYTKCFEFDAKLNLMPKLLLYVFIKNAKKFMFAFKIKI